MIKDWKSTLSWEKVKAACLWLISLPMTGDPLGKETRYRVFSNLLVNIMLTGSLSKYSNDVW